MLVHSLPAPRYYSYDPYTGEYVGSGLCDLSPARYPRKAGPVAGHLIEPNVPLVPGSSTLTPPPKNVPAHFVPCWDGKKWFTQEDRRGEVRWNGKEFVIVQTLGMPKSPPLQVHDAQYVLPNGAVDPSDVRIRVWINDDVIEIVDDPSQLPRQIVAAWEEAGETIRPIDDIEHFPIPPEVPIDAAAAHAVEGTVA